MIEKQEIFIKIRLEIGWGVKPHVGSNLTLSAMFYQLFDFPYFPANSPMLFKARI